MVSNPTSLGEGKVKCLICVGTSLPSKRPFGQDSISLSPNREGGGPKRSISCYGSRVMTQETITH
ncbi:unnamed protein product [Prunus armeniaca]